MDESAAQFLLSDAGESLLTRAANLPGDKPARVLALRKDGTISANVAALAAEIVVSRERAKRRGFAGAERLFFTEDALAQATSPTLAAYRAGYLAPFGTVADLCCGAGTDAIALAEAGANVIAVDIDPVRLLFARANAEIRGVADRITFRNEPVEQLGWTDADAAFFDPARRTDTARVSKHGERYAPPLEFLETIRAHVRGGCAKLSPALPDDVLRDLSPSRVEFLSENRECKEACVWFGDAAGASGAGEEFSAVLLGRPPIPGFPPIPPAPFPPSEGEKGGVRGGGVAASLDGFPGGEATPPLTPPFSPSEGGKGAGGIGGNPGIGGHYLLDPDPALIRADLLDTLCHLTNATLLTPDDAYLGTDTIPAGETTRAASAYRILVTMPYAPKKVSVWLRENGYKRIVIKKRHYPQEPEAVARELGVSVRGDGAEVTLVLARDSAKRFLAVLCELVAS